MSQRLQEQQEAIERDKQARIEALAKEKAEMDRRQAELAAEQEAARQREQERQERERRMKSQQVYMAMHARMRIHAYMRACPTSAA